MYSPSDIGCIVQSIPDWARETLQAHAKDPRPHVMTDQQLDKGETGDKVWDAAQYQLAVTGASRNILWH